MEREALARWRHGWQTVRTLNLVAENRGIFLEDGEVDRFTDRRRRGDHELLVPKRIDDPLHRGPRKPYALRNLAAASPIFLGTYRL